MLARPQWKQAESEMTKTRPIEPLAPGPPLPNGHYIHLSDSEWFVGGCRDFKRWSLFDGFSGAASPKSQIHTCCIHFLLNLIVGLAVVEDPLQRQQVPHKVLSQKGKYKAGSAIRRRDEKGGAGDATL